MWTKRLQMFLIIDIVQYDTNVYLLAMFNQGNHTWVVAINFLSSFLLHQNSLCLLNITCFKSWYSHMSMPLKPTQTLTNNPESQTWFKPHRYSSGTVNLPVLFSLQQSSLYPGCTSTVILLWLKKQGVDNMHLSAIFSSFHRRLPSTLELFSVQCSRHMAIRLWITWSMNIINFISTSTSWWSLHYVSTISKPSLCKSKLYV